MTICTIGYEGIDIDRFLSSLQAHDIETVVDIRELPPSGKPGFSKVHFYYSDLRGCFFNKKGGESVCR